MGRSLLLVTGQVTRRHHAGSRTQTLRPV